MLQTYAKAAICTVLTVIFLYLLCLVSKPSYCDETFVWVAFLPWLFIAAMIGLSYFQRKYRKPSWLTPLLFCIIIASCRKYFGPFEESTIHNLPPETCIALNRYVIDEIMTADENGQTEVLLTLPVTNRADYVTFSASFHGERVMMTMYRHRLIQRKMKVNQENSYEVNELFRLDEELQPMGTGD